MYAWVLIVFLFSKEPPLVVPGIASKSACQALHQKLAAAGYVRPPPTWWTVGQEPLYCFEYEIAPTK